MTFVNDLELPRLFKVFLQSPMASKVQNLVRLCRVPEMTQKKLESIPKPEVTIFKTDNKH